MMTRSSDVGRSSKGVCVVNPRGKGPKCETFTRLQLRQELRKKRRGKDMKLVINNKLSMERKRKRREPTSITDNS